jgi:hypothetical protein
MIDWNIVQAFEAAIEKKRASLEGMLTETDLATRLTRAFKEVSTHEDRLKIVQFAEGMVDPIWDY